MDTSFIHREPDWKFLDKVIENIKNIDKKDMMQCVREIYSATYYRYAMKWFEQKTRADKAEEVVIAKTGKIIDLQTIANTLLTHAKEGTEVDDKTLAELESLYEKNKE